MSDVVDGGSDVSRCEGWKRSSASARHWFSLPKRQSTKMKERMAASRMVNQAPEGILVRDDERKTPSKEPKMRKKNRTMKTLKRQITMATRLTRHCDLLVCGHDEREGEFVKEGWETNGCDECDEDNADAVCVSETCGVAVHSCDDDGTNHKKPVGERNVNLAMEEPRCMLDLDVWEVTHLKRRSVLDFCEVGSKRKRKGGLIWALAIILGVTYVHDLR